MAQNRRSKEPPKRRHRDKEGSRQAILAAARAQFAAHGFHGTTMRSIAASAGYALGLLQHHFGSKEQLFLSLVESLMAEQASLVIAVAPSGDLNVDLPQIIERVLDHIDQHQDLYRLAIMETLQGATFSSVPTDKLTTNLHEPIIKNIETVLLHALKKPAPDVHRLAGMIHFVAMSSAMIQRMLFQGELETVKADATSMAMAMLRGFLVESSTTQT